MPNRSKKGPRSRFICNAGPFFLGIINLVKYWRWFIQTLMWPAAWVLIWLFYKFEIRGRENLRSIKPPLIIVSNHKTLFDIFLIGSLLPFGSRFFPLRYMAEELQFRGPVLEFLRKIYFLKILYRLTGGFPSYRGEGIEKAIECPLKILVASGTVLMFPEGRLIRGEGLGTFYHGTSALALKSGVLILPVHIRIRDKKILVTVGVPFKLQASSPESGTLILREKISSLRYN